MTEVAELLLPAWRSGEIGLVNAFGNGVADDKLVHGHVEDFIRFYLGQEPLVASVPTRMLRRPRRAPSDARSPARAGGQAPPRPLVGGLDGETLGDGRVRHVYAVRDGLVGRMDVEQGDAAA
jgi:hypothetical protein